MDVLSAAPTDPRAEVPLPGSLGLFRLRLILLALAVAAFPVLVAVPLFSQALGGETVDAARQASAEGVSRSLVIEERLRQVRDALDTLAADPALGAAADAEAPQFGVDTTAALAALDSLDPALAPTATVIDEEGSVRVRVRGTSGAPLAGDPDNAFAEIAEAALQAEDGHINRTDPYDVGSETHLTLAVPLEPVSAGWEPPGAVLIEISLPILVRAPEAWPASAEMSVTMVDSTTGTVLDQAAISEAANDSVRLPVDPVAPPANPPAKLAGDPPANPPAGTPAVRGTMILPVAVPGLTDLAVRIEDPRLPPPRPLEQSLALLGAGALLLLGTAWVTRRMIGQVHALEGAREKLSKLYRSARMDSLRDVLTGLGNHRAFQEEFDRELEHAKRYNTPLGLLLVDLDDFKMVNDSAGHDVGDELLSEMGRLVLATMRRTDRAFRIGGDEFAILMPHTDSEAGYILGRRLLAATLQPRINTQFGRPFSFSAGVSAYPQLGTTRRQLFTQADAAVYSAKRHGRTAVEVFDPSRNRHTLQEAVRGELSAAVADVASSRALHPVYQPIVELATGRVLGYEGLVRPVLTAVFADAGTLFAAAEAAGRTIELDQACMEAVVAGAQDLPDDRMLNINISPRTLEAPEFSAPALLATLARYGLKPDRVVLELTEREAVEDLDRLRRNLATCQAAGIRIAADDVGAGNAGLRLLSQIHFDIVKIDLSLVQGGTLRDSSLAVLRSLRDLAGRWGAMVIAEGVETEEQLHMLRDLGITAGQGYLLGRPSEDLQLEPLGIDAILGRTDRRSTRFGGSPQAAMAEARR